MYKEWSEKANICDEFVLSVYDEYSVDTVSNLLLPTGLLIDDSVQYTGTFEEYVFLYGKNDEVYSKPEIDFISSAGDIVVFKEIYKETKKGVIPCRIIAVRNTHFDSLDFSIAFTKINNKANEGFNICVVISEDGIIFTCRSYDDSSSIDYYISDVFTTEEQLEELGYDLMYISDSPEFVEYYSQVRDYIKSKSNPTARSQKNKKYCWALCADENDEGEYEETFADRLADADEYLFKIESSRVNTMEMLFEAEEMERMASEAEQNNEAMLMQNKNEDDNMPEDIDEETKTLLNDPESMIKLLKKKRGI